mmetsp:Transcript_29269/g.53664  ORF Transcript_29269/g.53664 Transcript_29269/m.53664 type:complete len:289 (+) Transcript_29269:593-1459(+)
MRFWPGYPAEKFVIRGGGSFVTPSNVLCPNMRRDSESKSTRGTPFWSAWETLLLPGSLPTRTKSVFPDTAEVTRPPKDSIMPFVRSLPSVNPVPPPSSGKTPVKTKRLPSNTPAIAPLTPGRRMRNLAFFPACGTMADAALFPVFVLSRTTIAWVLTDTADAALAAAGFDLSTLVLNFGFAVGAVAAGAFEAGDTVALTCGVPFPREGGETPAVWYIDPRNASLVKAGRFFNSWNDTRPRSSPCNLSRLIISTDLLSASLNLLAIASLPTRRKFVFLENLVITLPPND